MRKTLISIFSIFIFFIVSGCGTSGSSTVTLSPMYSIISKQLTLNNGVLNIQAEISLKETNNKVTDVSFSNLDLNDSSCAISSYSITPMSNGNYSLDINYSSSCTDISNLYFNGTETANYIDGELKSVSQTFSFNIGKDFQSDYEALLNETSGTAPVLSKIILDPSNIKVVEGLSQSIRILTLDQNNKPISATLNINMPIDENNKIYGTFSTYTLTTDSNGEANVTYTAPNSLTGLNSEFNVTVSGDNNVNAKLQLVIQSSGSETNTTAVNYVINVTQPDKFVVDSEGSLIINIVEEDNQNSYIDNTNVYDVNVSVVNGLMFFNADKNETVYEYNSSSSKYINVYTGIYSGIETLNVKAKIFNGDKNVTVSQTVPIVIESGPIASISINYVSSSYDTTYGLFEDTYSIHAVDKYSNPARAGSKIVVGAIVGNKVWGNGGKIDFNITISKTEFTDTNGTLFTSVEDQDSVAVFANANRTDGSYLGGWIVDSKSSDNKTLYFTNDYNGTVVNALTYVIGNEKRNNSCTGGVAVADFDHQDGTYEIGDNGTTLLILRYDRYLVGKTVALYANSFQDKRIGVAMKRILWGTGVTGETKTCDATNATSKVNCLIQIGLSLNADSSFKLENTQTGGYDIECKDGGYTVNSSGTTTKTDCNGLMDLNITVDAGASCSIKWNRSVVYEY
ncbi:hypothetical protein [Nautilia sp.]